MKTTVFLTFLFASASLLFADCDPTISSTDTIGDVKKKLACFAQENAQLKQEVLKTQSQPGQGRISWSVPMLFFRKSLSADACKTKAIDSVVKRGGVVIEQGDKWVDLHLGDKAVSVLCDSIPADTVIGPNYNSSVGRKDVSIGYVIVFGHKSDENHDLISLLASEIFLPL
jgi:hypothetical protein